MGYDEFSFLDRCLTTKPDLYQNQKYWPSQSDRLFLKDLSRENRFKKDRALAETKGTVFFETVYAVSLPQMLKVRHAFRFSFPVLL